MSPFVSSSGLSPGSHKAKVQRAKVCLNCTKPSVARSSCWSLPVGRYLSDTRCKGSVVVLARWTASNMAKQPQTSISHQVRERWTTSGSSDFRIWHMASIWYPQDLNLLLICTFLKLMLYNIALSLCFISLFVIMFSLSKLGADQYYCKGIITGLLQSNSASVNGVLGKSCRHTEWSLSKDATNLGTQVNDTAHEPWSVCSLNNCIALVNSFVT